MATAGTHVHRPPPREATEGRHCLLLLRTAAESGHPADEADVAVAVYGFGTDTTPVRGTYLMCAHRMMADGVAELGRPAL
ncbi:hypothetical protein [Streptomyces pactum]|uniref:hypothetical protein n=1 Tax=Streptomyces pactum TaxID=68249 RepID=UPI00131E0FF3|nr:hypothetical protein [Streptomyces pactum]